MATALQESLRSEQRLTAHVAYALRKPLTGLVTAAELLPDDELDARAEHVDLTARAAGSLVKEAVACTAVPARLHMDGARRGLRLIPGSGHRVSCGKRQNT
ncbi:hypothetical protein AB0P37_45625 [Streptomyces antimycoticus]|uniref:hypothetical protein n=1 Tax=Streptomyces antimycoticus TaxID=68175 RepID=UPI00341D237A